MAANQTKKMQLTFEQIRQIEAEHGSPCYIFDEEAFRKNYDDIVKAFSGRYERFILAYSYKTNYIPYLCGIIREKGGWAEVVSRLEYDLALKVGQDPAKIIFNGPVKCYEDIELALANKSIVNLDAMYEVDYVTKYAREHPDEQVRVGLRINIDLSDEASLSQIQDQFKVGRFGFDLEDIEQAASRLTASENIVVNSLHGHSTTPGRSVKCYEVIARMLCDAAERYFAQTVEYINVGGGIYGYIPPEMRWTEVPTFDDYAGAVCGVMNASDWARKHQPRLVLEPGVAMVANALSFVTKVVSTKTIRGKLFVTVDGSAFHVKPTFHRVNQPHRIISAQSTDSRQRFSVVGSTCMEKDYLLTDIVDVMPHRGDYIKIDSVGAYTVVLSPDFIYLSPAIVVNKGGRWCGIRRRQTFDDMFGCYSFDF